MTPGVRIRLEDMLSYSEGAIDLLARHGRDGIMAEWGLQQGLIKALEVVGEAAWRIPKEARPADVDLPWERVSGLRHHLVHGYSAVRMEVLFGIVEDRLPPLVSQLKQLLGEEPSA